MKNFIDILLPSVSGIVATMDMASRGVLVTKDLVPTVGDTIG